VPSRSGEGIGRRSRRIKSTRHNIPTPMTTTNTEPLKPDPKWVRINNAPYTSENHTADGSLDSPPRAYAQGFEDGAYALAAVLFEAMKENDLAAPLKLLLDYQSGRARPARGWIGESARP
jgi:hypothetical protein